MQSIEALKGTGKKGKGYYDFQKMCITAIEQGQMPSSIHTINYHVDSRKHLSLHYIYTSHLIYDTR